MRRKGSITVLSLIVMAVILISSLYLIYITKLQTIISSSYNNKIQSNYLAESKLNMLLYNDKYFIEQLLPTIKDYVKTPISNESKYAKITMDKSDIDESDESDKSNIIDIEYFFKDSEHMMGISSKSIYNGIENEIKAYGTLVNDLYHYGNGKVISKLNNKDIKETIEIIEEKITLSELPPEIKGIYTYDKDNIVLTYKSRYSVNMQFNENNKETINTGDGIFFILKNKLFTPIKLHVKESEPGKTVVLKGIIYIEGDLVISTDFQLNGLLILNGGKIIVNYDEKPVFKGIILTDGDTDYSDSIIMEPNYQGMCMYGVYLPDFIDPKIEVIKKY